MAQRPKIIDTKQSYQPVDPATWIPESYTNERTDSPDVVDGAVAYDGFNFLPTSYGYKSYFGLDPAFPYSIPDRIQDVIFFQLDTLENIGVALGEQGIWTKRADAPWVLVARDAGGSGIEITPVMPEGMEELTEDNFEEIFTGYDQTEAPVVMEARPHFLWSHCVIENVLYCYRANSRTVWTISAKAEIARSTSVTPSLKLLQEWTDGPVNAEAVTLPVGVYSISVSFAYWAITALGTTELAETELIDMGQGFLSDDGHAWQFIFEGLQVLPVEMRIYYSLDGDPYRMCRVFPPTHPNVNMLWETLDDAEDVPEWPPQPTIVAQGTVQSHTPTFLNMGEQQGIFRAGFQLGFWDSANAIACSSVLDPFEFEPSVETMASITTYPKIRGKIVTIIPEENNFIVYSTKSIVRCLSGDSAVQQWTASSIHQLAGISYPRCVTIGTNEVEHFAYTNIGLLRILDGQSEVLMPALYDTLSQRSEEVIYLTCLAGRYLCFSSANPIYAPVDFAQTYIPPIGPGEGSACENLYRYVAQVRKNGPTFRGEMAWLNYYISGKAGIDGDAAHGYKDGSPLEGMIETDWGSTWSVKYVFQAEENALKQPYPANTKYPMW